jgi:multiple sugar transport system permease protein
MTRKRRLSNLGTYSFIIPFCIVMLFPFIVMFISALKSNGEIFVSADEFRWIPQNPLWSNFVTIHGKIPLIGRYFLNSLIIAGGSTLLSVFVALPAAYVLARLRFRGRTVFLQLVLVTQMFSPIVIIIGLYKLFAHTSVAWFSAGAQKLGAPADLVPPMLIDNLFGLILANAAFNVAFAIWLLSGYFATVPREVEEASMVDGCTWFQTVTRVLMPLAAPGIVTAVIFVFIAAWNEFIFALTLLSSPEKKPIIIGLFSLIGMYEIEWNYVMAGSLLAIVPVVILFWLAEKHLVSGLTAGAIK